jgi:hypothetical protein
MTAVALGQNQRPNWRLSHGQQVTANTLFALATVLALAYVVHIARRDNKVWPLFLFLGAGLTVFYEPINNVLGHCTYPESHLLTWIQTFGRKIPVYIGFCYFFYFSAAVLWIMGRIEAGITSRQWWRYYAVGVVAATSFELIPIHLKWWLYYGSAQSPKVLGFPMWWWFANPECLFATATLLYFLRKHVVKEQLSVLLVPLFPMAIFATHGAVAIPVFTALNSTTNRAVTTLASLLTIALALMVMWLCGKLVARSSVRSERREFVRAS